MDNKDWSDNQTFQLDDIQRQILDKTNNSNNNFEV